MLAPSVKKNRKDKFVEKTTEKQENPNQKTKKQRHIKNDNNFVFLQNIKRNLIRKLNRNDT